MCSSPLVLSHTHLRRASASSKQVVEDTIKVFPVWLLFLRLNQPGFLCLFLYVMCPSLQGLVEMLQKIPVGLVLGAVLQTQSDKHRMEWKKSHLPWLVSYTSQTQPSSCLVSFCSVRKESQSELEMLWRALVHMQPSHLPLLSKSASQLRSWSFWNRRQHWGILVTVKNISALPYQRVVSVQCGTCLEFLPNGKSFRFFSPAANKLDQGIKNEPLKEHDWLCDFALAAHWAFILRMPSCSKWSVLPCLLGSFCFCSSSWFFPYL